MEQFLDWWGYLVIAVLPMIRKRRDEGLATPEQVPELRRPFHARLPGTYIPVDRLYFSLSSTGR